jgi:phosphatidylglycerol:prolipoprotein diacylglycerol transferase
MTLPLTLLVASPLAAPMAMLALSFPDFDPVAIQIGPLAIKWYGLAYMAGLILGWIYIRRLLTEGALWPRGMAPFTPARTDDLLLFMTVGVVIGGRLGFVLLYEPGHYLANPHEILMVWKGGMAFHGALLGCGLAIWLFARFYAVPVLGTMDLCAAAVPIGLFFGRVANFVNGELWGRPTDMPWGMVFPEAQQMFRSLVPVPRHPSQLYEAALEGIALFLLLRFMTHHRAALQTPGITTGLFLIGYALARSFCELYRSPHPGHALNVGGLTAGIAYSIPMLLLGLWFIWYARNRTERAA